MDTIFLACAVVGGTLIVCQFLLTLLGLSGDHDADSGGHDVGGGHEAIGGHDAAGHDGAGHDHGAHDHASSWFFGMLTVRTLSAAAAFFGLTGMTARQAQLNEIQTILLATAAGLGAFFLAGWLMRFLYKLNQDGTIRIDRAVGCRGSVYLSIPAEKTGAGKVHVNVFNRTQEYQAITAQHALTTGMPIVVVGIVGPDTVEVAPATTQETAHG